MKDELPILYNPKGIRSHWRYFSMAFVRLVRRWGKDTSLWMRFWKDLDKFNCLAGERLASPEWLVPKLYDCTTTTPIPADYFYQDAWAFELIAQHKPSRHVDIGSHYKYVSLLSKIVPLTMVDIRPLCLPMDTIHFLEGSITGLPFLDGSVSSLSSLCVVEHIGLGRYGDEIDPWGTDRAVSELLRVLAPGGKLYISVPLSDSTRVCFNAHREFRESDFLAKFGKAVLRQSRYIQQDRLGEEYYGGRAVGCYWFEKEGVL